MFGTGSLLDQLGSASALLVTVIALGGFLGHARPALRGDEERRIREATARGGLFGLALALLVGVLSAILAKLSP